MGAGRALAADELAMGSRGWAPMLLVQLCALQGATSLTVQQSPVDLRVMQGGQANLTCRLTQTQAWERLRVEWTKDGALFCQALFTSGTHSPGRCGPRGQLSWLARGEVRLQLDWLALNDSGAYVCRATVEIPELEKGEGNRTQLLVYTDASQQDPSRTPRVSGLLWVLLVAGGVAVAVAAVSALGAVLWGRRCRRRKDAGNPFYGNVLYRPREIPKRSRAWPGQGKALDIPREDQKAQRVYATSFPQPSTRPPQPAPKPGPSSRPTHPVFTVRVSPDPGNSR
ncbi:transmembrane and immunoglobulin domain-containing protein 2 [Cavia porcellus]|uniref:transmembrane and immunoglobulin domain-containing protein 2 n=1 Tax=Cavia porcellus TaxID=10141 RepID=UPI002FE3C1BE